MAEYDRITDILTKRAAQPTTVAPNEYQALRFANMFNPAQFNQQASALEQTRRDEPLRAEMDLMRVMEAKRAAGDRQAEILDRRIKMFTGEDPQGYSLFMNELHSDPEEIDPSNSYQLMTKLAGIQKKTGYISPDLAAKKELAQLELEGKRLGLERDRSAISLNRAKAGKAKAEANAASSGGGPFAGKALDAQMLNILLTGDPNSPEYRASYAQMAQPKVQVDPVTGSIVRVAPDMSAFRTPGGGSAPTSTVDIVEGTGLTRDERKNLKKAEVSAAQINKALDDYASAFKNAGVEERAKSLADLPTKLNTQFGAAALLAKGEELFNLGVLNGPDLEIIRRTLSDPSTFGGAAADPETVQEQVNVIKDILNTRIQALKGGEMPPMDDSGWSIEEVD